MWLKVVAVIDLNIWAFFRDQQNWYLHWDNKDSNAERIVKFRLI